MNQGDLFDQRPAFVTPDHAATIQERFEAFERANPWVLTSLIRLADSYRRRGARRIGIKHLIEVLRWEFHKATEGDEFKLNNSFTSRYARAIRQARPDIGELIETRELKAA